MAAAYQIASPAPDFSAAVAGFEAMKTYMSSRDALGTPHTDLEQYLLDLGAEVERQLLQAHLDWRATQEQRVPVVDEADKGRPVVRRAARTLITAVGKVIVSRRLYQAPGLGARAPLDASLRLPADLYSHVVQQRIADHAARDVFDGVQSTLKTTTNAHVPKRQIERVARGAAQDFDAFYTQRSCGPMGSDVTLLVLSFDGKGVPMLHRDLRPATKKAAEKKAATRHTRPCKRLASGEKRHRKRMAEVAAVYGLRAVPRTPADIVGELHVTKDARPARPTPVSKRVWASPRQDLQEVIEEGFQEGLRRDPTRALRWVVLADGNETQLEQIEQAARKFQVEITIVLDIIHVLEYLWKAAYDFHCDGTPEAEAWVQTRLCMLLEGVSPSDVAGGIRRSATLQGLVERRATDRCADYLCKYRDLMDYAGALRDGLPIATGVIEGACRSLVKDRMERAGARWSLEGAEAVLRLRALRASGDFEAYWTFHLDQEFTRNHASRYAHGTVPDPMPSQTRRATLRLAN
jgi:hypothetical protein